MRRPSETQTVIEGDAAEVSTFINIQERKRCCCCHIGRRIPSKMDRPTERRRPQLHDPFHYHRSIDTSVLWESYMFCMLLQTVRSLH